MYSILVIRAGQLGDTVCASSIIDALRIQFGESARIDWVAKAGIGKIFAQDPRINRVFELSSRRAPILFNPGKRAVVIESWRKPYDLIINLELASFFNNTVRLIRARRKIGMPYRYFQEPAETHAVENLHLIYRSFLDEKAMQNAQPKLIGSDQVELRERFKLSPSYVALIPSNSHHQLAPEKNYRNWPVEHWKAFIQLLAEQNRQVVVVGGKSESAFFEYLKPYPDAVVDLVGKTSFPDLISVLQMADAVVSSDTGPAHVAAAVNTPVYVLIGPTNPKRTAPYSTKDNAVHVLSAGLSCSPCYHSERFKQCTKNQCMHDIQPETVLKAIQAG